MCLVSFLNEKTMVIVCVLLQPGDLGSRQALSVSVVDPKSLPVEADKLAR